MAKRTRKVGICGKFGTRYGASLRKMIKKFEESQHSRYVCPFCGKNAIKRKAVGIWRCRGCGKNIAGGAWELTTPAALTIKATVHRLKTVSYTHLTLPTTPYV
eukprot:TRINITY_DN354_c0_g1_i2.p1 TRINITY_DN354_c0_g1~~TRINITY_DN354_c0_g1_i2.p1  ORF type:complete len:103 (+),score=34.09 TRINITY_DN354_c0_g1_i2:18-326(+)